MIYEHGGDIYNNDIELDFSVNLNAFGMPESVKRVITGSLDKAENYPDPDWHDLRDAIAAWEKTHTGADLVPEQIICGNGASELIHTIIQASWPSSAIIQTPGFYGYERSLEAADCRIIRGDSMSVMPGVKLRSDREGIYFMPTEKMADQIRSQRPDMVILCNPSNPVGSCINEEILKKILAAAREVKARIVIDECFLPFCSDFAGRSAVRFLKDYPNMMIIRAFTKLYAMPGIRLGYAISGARLWGEQTLKLLPEWNVGTLAQAAGIAALKDEEYLKKSLSYISKQKEVLMQKLMFLGMDVIPGKANFLLFRSPHEVDLKQALLHKGILIRSCNNYPGLPHFGFYRVCVKKEEDNDRLIEVLKSAF